MSLPILTFSESIPANPRMFFKDSDFLITEFMANGAALLPKFKKFLAVKKSFTTSLLLEIKLPVSPTSPLI